MSHASAAIGPSLPGDRPLPDQIPTGLHQWPFRWVDARRLALVYVALSTALIVTGRLIVGPLDGSIGAVDRRLARHLTDHRTHTNDVLSAVGTNLAETWVKILVTLLLAGVVMLVWRSWGDVVLLCGALALEAGTFLTITLIVARHRPDVSRLDSSPVGSSFPSGHVAAAVAYGAFAVVLLRHGHRVVAILVTVVVTGVAVYVAWARMYRGMHYLSDTIAGGLLGLTSVIVASLLVPLAEQRYERERA